MTRCCRCCSKRYRSAPPHGSPQRWLGLRAMRFIRVHWICRSEKT